MDKLLIIGSTGLLGTHLWKKAISNYKLIGVHYGEIQSPKESSYLDITDLIW